MTKKEEVNKNIELTFAFIRQIIDNPEIAEQLPNKCEIDFIEKDFSAVIEKNLSSKQLIKVNHAFEIVSSHQQVRTQRA